MSEDTLLLAIETLHKKLTSLTETLWATERQLIDTQNELKIQQEQNEHLQDSIKYKDQEIEDLYNALEASDNLDKLCHMQAENLKLIKKCEDAQSKYQKLHESLKHIYDIDFIM